MKNFYYIVLNAIYALLNKYKINPTLIYKLKVDNTSFNSRIKKQV